MVGYVVNAEYLDGDGIDDDDPNPDGDGDSALSDTVVSYDLYKLSSMLQDYRSSYEFEKGDYTGNAHKDVFNNLSAGEYASYITYNDQDWATSLVSSVITQSSDSYGYLSLATKGVVNDSTAYVDTYSNNPGLAYARYGWALNKLGLDKTGTAGINIGRFVSGNLLWLALIINMVFSKAFNIVLGPTGLLQKLNPFAFFVHGLTEVDNISNLEFFQNMNTESTVANTLTTLTNFLSDLYKQLYNLSWAVIPIFLAFLIFNILMIKNYNKGSGIKKYIIRVAFVVIGIPVLAGLYTATLDQVSDYASKNGANAASIIGSTLVDFEGWAENTNLDAPLDSDGKPYVVIADDNRLQSTQVTRTAESRVRDMAMAINRKSSNVFHNTLLSGSGYSEDIMASTGGRYYGSENVYDTLFSMVNRYKDGSFYMGSDYASMLYSVNVESNDGTVAPLRSNTDAKKFFENNLEKTGTLASSVSGNKHIKSAVINGKNYEFISGLVTDDTELHVVGATGSVELQACQATAIDPTECHALDRSQVGYSGHLSVMGMYNYLSTDFRDSGITVYSGKNASSTFIKSTHYSVNLVGTGFLSALYFANAFVLLLVAGIIAIIYSLGMGMNVVRSGVKMIMDVPFAMIGSMRAIGRVIVITLAMLVEIIGTLVMFSVVNDLLLLVISTIDDVLKSMGLGVFTVVISLILSLIAGIIWLFYAIKLRKSFIKGVDEAIQAIIDRFFETSTGDIGNQKGGLVPALAGGVAAGAGLSAGRKAFEKFAGKGEEKDEAYGDETPGRSSYGTGSGEDEDDGPEGDGMAAGKRIDETSAEFVDSEGNIHKLSRTQNGGVSETITDTEGNSTTEAAKSYTFKDDGDGNVEILDQDGNHVGYTTASKLAQQPNADDQSEAAEGTDAKGAETTKDIPSADKEEKAGQAIATQDSLEDGKNAGKEVVKPEDKEVEVEETDVNVEKTLNDKTVVEDESKGKEVAKSKDKDAKSGEKDVTKDESKSTSNESGKSNSNTASDSGAEKPKTKKGSILSDDGYINNIDKDWGTKVHDKLEAASDHSRQTSAVKQAIKSGTMPADTDMGKIKQLIKSGDTAKLSELTQGRIREDGSIDVSKLTGKGATAAKLSMVTKTQMADIAGRTSEFIGGSVVGKVGTTVANAGIGVTNVGIGAGRKVNGAFNAVESDYRQKLAVKTLTGESVTKQTFKQTLSNVKQGMSSRLDASVVSSGERVHVRNNAKSGAKSGAVEHSTEPVETVRKTAKKGQKSHKKDGKEQSASGSGVNLTINDLAAIAMAAKIGASMGKKD